MPVRDKVRRFLQKPGTANLTRFRRLLPAIAAREEALRQVPDDERTGGMSRLAYDPHVVDCG